jgi:hypothetical protein
VEDPIDRNSGVTEIVPELQNTERFIQPFWWMARYIPRYTRLHMCPTSKGCKGGENPWLLLAPRSNQS